MYSFHLAEGPVRLKRLPQHDFIFLHSHRHESSSKIRHNTENWKQEGGGAHKKDNRSEFTNESLYLKESTAEEDEERGEISS